MQAEFKSSDLGRVIRIWQKNLKYFNDRLTIRPKVSNGFWDILSPFQQAYAEVVATVDGGTMVTFRYPQALALGELLAEAHIALPDKARILGTGVNNGGKLQVAVVRIPGQISNETRLQFIIQVLIAISEEPLPETFTVKTERIHSSQYP